jgi:hypothetical protein
MKRDEVVAMIRRMQTDARFLREAIEQTFNAQDGFDENLADLDNALAELEDDCTFSETLEEEQAGLGTCASCGVSAALQSGVCAGCMAEYWKRGIILDDRDARADAELGEGHCL